MQLNGQEKIYRFYKLDAGRNVTGVYVAIRFFHSTGVNMRSLLLASFFLSTATMACPDLSGTYATCKNKAGEITDTNLVITQAVRADGVTVYTTTSTDQETGERVTDDLVADGKEVSSTSAEQGIEITTRETTSCEGDAVVMNAAFDIQGQNIGEIRISVNKEGAVMMTRSSGTIFGESADDETVCE